MYEILEHSEIQDNQVVRLLPDQAATVALGAALAQVCDRESTVYLLGELGVGKTTCCRGFLAALGHHGSVKSPTYTLVEPYLLPPFHVYHFDLYRLSNPAELELIGIRDYQHANALSLIEWPQQGAGFLPPADVTMHLCYHASGRQAILQATSHMGLLLLQRMGDIIE